MMSPDVECRLPNSLQFRCSIIRQRNLFNIFGMLLDVVGYDGAIVTTAAMGRIARGGGGEKIPTGDEQDGVETAIAYYASIPLAGMSLVIIIAVLLCMKRSRANIEERRTPIPERHRTANVTNATREGRVNEAFVVPEMEIQDGAGRPESDRSIIAAHRSKPFMPPKNAAGQPVEKAVLISIHHAKKSPREHALKPSLPGGNQSNSICFGTGYDAHASRDFLEHNLAVNQRDKISATAPNVQLPKPQPSQKRHFSRQVQRQTPRLVKETRTDGKEFSPEMVKLSKYRTLQTDLDRGAETKAEIKDSHVARNANYSTLKRTGSRSRRLSERNRDAETKWAIENHLTRERSWRKYKLSPRRLSRRSIIGRDHRIQSIEDLPSDVCGLNGARRRPSFRQNSSRTLSHSPYKLQFQNKIRPNRKILHRDGTIRKKSSSILRKSFRQQPTRVPADPGFYDDDRPSFYMGFDTPLPPPLETTPEESETSQKIGNADANTVGIVEVYPQSSTKTQVERTLTAASDHDYQEIEDLGKDGDMDLG